MWIFLSVLLFIIILITVVLLLPVFITIKYNKDDGLYLRYKILHKTFGGESSSSDNAFAKNIKSALGLSRLEKDKLKTKAEKTNILHTVKDSFSLIVDLLKELVGLLKYCKAIEPASPIDFAFKGGAVSVPAPPTVNGAADLPIEARYSPMIRSRKFSSWLTF